MSAELVERAQRGDREAFGALAAAAYHRLYRIARRILRDGCDAAFLRLPIDHRAVLVLVHHVGMSAAEVADFLRIPTGTVYSRRHHGASGLRCAVGRRRLH